MHLVTLLLLVATGAALISVWQALRKMHAQKKADRGAAANAVVNRALVLAACAGILVLWANFSAEP